MKVEVGPVWCSMPDGTAQAEVMSVSGDGLHATLRRITHGMGTFQLDIAAILAEARRGHAEGATSC
jgi:hypothetical protein